MRVKDVMVRDVELLPPGESVQEAARLMAELDTRALLVGEHGRADGIVTDRDILIRLVADGRDAAATTVGDIASRDLFSCGEDEDLDEVARAMESRRVRRMPVLDAEGRVLGLITLQRLTEAEAAR